MTLKRPSAKELKFAEILLNMVTQFAECSQEEAMDFVVVIQQKMEAENIRIKIK